MVYTAGSQALRGLAGGPVLFLFPFGAGSR